MRNQFGFMATAVALTAVACGGGSSGEVRQLAEACATSTNIGPETCECIANKAKEDLTEDGFAMLLAMLNEDEEAAEDLRGKLAMEDVMAAGMFMTRAPAACAGEVGGN